MTATIERAVRAHITAGQRLHTPARRAPFSVARVDADGVVLLLGAKQAWTRLRWDCLEGVAGFLRGRGWVSIGGVFSVDGAPDTLDGYLKRCVKRATAGWVAAMLAAADVVEIDPAPPARVRLKTGY